MSNSKRTSSRPPQKNTEVNKGGLLRVIIFLGLIISSAVAAVLYYSHTPHSTHSYNHGANSSGALPKPVPVFHDKPHSVQDVKQDIKKETKENKTAVTQALTTKNSSKHVPIFYTGKNMSVAIFPEDKGKSTFWLGIAFHQSKDGTSCDGALSNSSSTAINHVQFINNQIILEQPLDPRRNSLCRITLNKSLNSITSSHERTLHKVGLKFKNSFDRMQASCAGQHGASCTFNLSGSSSRPIMKRSALNAENLVKLSKTFGADNVQQLTAEMKRH